MAMTYVVFGGQFRAGTFLDNDDLLRLKQVQDLLAGKAWYDLHEPRFGPPAGLDIHWSRLVDGALAALIAAVSLFTPRAQAEQIVLLFYPLALIAPAVLAAVSIGRSLAGRVGGRLAGTLAAIHTAACFAPSFFQFRPGRIDHHNVQTVLAIWLFATVVALDGKSRSGLKAALVFALMMAIGFETLPFAGLALLVIAWRFVIIGDAAGEETKGFLFGIALLPPILLMVQTAPERWLLSVCDSLGFNMAAGLTVGAVLGLALMATTNTATLTRRLLLVLTSATGSLSVAIALEPRCLAGPFGQYSAAVRTISFDLTSELQPILPSFALADLFVMAVAPIVFGAIAVVALAMTNPKERGLYLTAGAFIALAGALGLMMNRNFPYAALFASPVIAAGLVQGVRHSALNAAMKPFFLAAGLIFSIPLVPALNLDRLARKAPASETATAPIPCERPGDYAKLAQLTPSLVLAPPSIGTAIVTQTPHSALSGPFHRLGDFLPDVYHVFQDTPENAHAYAKTVGAGYVALCKTATVTNKAPPSFAELAVKGTSFDWLEPIDTDGPLLIWKVR